MKNCGRYPYSNERNSEPAHNWANSPKRGREGKDEIRQTIPKRVYTAENLLANKDAFEWPLSKKLTDWQLGFSNFVHMMHARVLAVVLTGPRE